MTSGGVPSGRRWVLACVAAETIGMTAAASAARLADSWAGEGAAWRLLAWAVVVAGGLVEGTALGTLQARALDGWLGARHRRRWLIATLVVAGVGWAGASVPSVLASGGSDASEPPWAVVLAGAAGLGLAMGALLGAAQALALRGAVAGLGWWLAGSTAGWTVAMVVIFAGATAPSADTPTGLVVLLGTATGAAAGALLGLVTHPFLRRLDQSPAMRVTSTPPAL